jgi:hypothetical protein
MKRNVTSLILGLQVLILMGQWLGNSGPTPAMAQVADAGAQRAQIIEQLKDINGKLDQLLTVIGNLKGSGHPG